MTLPVAQHRTLLAIVAALLLVAWGGFGFYQGLNRGFSGGLYDPNFEVPGVVPGSAAERAGFRPGDRVISVDGTPVESLGMESRWPRAFASQIGQSRRFLVQRQGETIPIDYVYAAPSPRAVNSRIGAAIVGLGFLCIGVWAFCMPTNAAANMLGYMGLTSGVAMSLGLGPSLGTWNGLTDHISTAASVLLLILMLRFLEIFPKTKPLSTNRVATWLTFVPWLGLLLFLGLEILVHPALYYTTGSVTAPLMLVYGILIFAVLIHTVAKSSFTELVDSGMALVIVGFAIAILGMVATFFLLVRIPGWAGSVPVVAIPLTMALAVRKQARRGSLTQQAIAS